MRTYYFDIKDGVPIRDRTGLELPRPLVRSSIARRLRRDPRISDCSFSIVVIDESGAEVHREPVYLGGPQAGAAWSARALGIGYPGSEH
jgi:hypothetical protein